MIDKSAIKKTLEILSRPPDEHGVENCGHCLFLQCQAEAAQEVLTMDPLPDDGLIKMSDLHWQKWKSTEMYEVFKAEKLAGRDPKEAFAKRGWNP